MRIREVASKIAAVINGTSTMDSISVWKAGRGLEWHPGLIFFNDETVVAHFRKGFFVNIDDLKKTYHKDEIRSYATYQQTVKSIVEYLQG